MLPTVLTIARHELRVMSTDAVLRTGAAACAAAMILAVVMGMRYAALEARDALGLEEWQASLHARSAADAARLPDVAPSTLPPWGARHPDFAANERGAYAALRPAPLLAITLGQSDLQPNHYRVTARLREGQSSGDELNHPMALVAGQIDLAFVALYLYPLVILASSFDLTASERDTGTLRMMLAQPVTLRAVLAGKLAARMAIVATLPLLALASAPLTTDMTPATLVRLTLWTTAVLAYGSFWLGAAVIVDARGRSAPNNALVLAGIWLVFVLLVPGALNLALRHTYPVPSRVEFATSVRAATRDAVAEGSRRLGRFLEDHPSSGLGVEGMRQYAMLQEARDLEIVRRMQPLQDRYESQLARQRAFVAGMQYLSPAVVLHLALTDIAGTGDARQARFRTEVARFQERWRAFFEPRLLAVSALSPMDYDNFPTFAYSEEPVASVLRRSAVPLTALAATGAAFWVTGFWLYRRYELTR